MPGADGRAGTAIAAASSMMTPALAYREAMRRKNGTSAPATTNSQISAVASSPATTGRRRGRCSIRGRQARAQRDECEQEVDGKPPTLMAERDTELGGHAQRLCGESERPEEQGTLLRIIAPQVAQRCRQDHRAEQRAGKCRLQENSKGIARLIIVDGDNNAQVKLTRFCTNPALLSTEAVLTAPSVAAR